MFAFCFGRRPKSESVLAFAMLGLAVLLTSPSSAWTQVIALPPYIISVFARAPQGLSAPDSVTFSATNVFVGYGNGGAADGSGGAMSYVVEYDFTGNEIQRFPIVGHNDGLRYNPLTNDLWTVQNEDGNANLSVIDLKSGKQTIFELGTGPHGGGYDDIDFKNKSVFLTASSPTLNPNSAPAIVRLKIVGGEATLSAIVDGDAIATDVTTGDTVTLNLQDPDSMIVDPLGELVMTSQADGRLVIGQFPGLRCQRVLTVPLTSEAGGTTVGDTQLDDTVFTNETTGQLLVADKGLDTVYSITAPYFAASAYSAVSIFPSLTATNSTESFVGQTNLTTGFVAPIVNGMSNPGGMAFIPSGVDLKQYVKASAQIPVACPSDHDKGDYDKHDE